MKIELLAQSKDGSAVIRAFDKLFFGSYLKDLTEWEEINDSTMARLLCDATVALLEAPFTYYTGAMLRHDLEESRIATSTPEEREQAKSAAAELLTFATAEQAARHLSRIEQQLAGIGKALHALSHAQAVGDSPELQGRIAELRNQLPTEPVR